MQSFAHVAPYPIQVESPDEYDACRYEPSTVVPWRAPAQYSPLQNS